MTMRIALVSEHANPLAALGGADAGGQNVHVANLAAGLSRLGAEVRVYTRRDSTGAPAVTVTDSNVSVHLIDAGPPWVIPKDDMFRYMPEFGDRLFEEFGRWRPSVVHAHFWMSGVASHAVARRIGAPFVQTFHALGTVKRRHQGAEDTSPSERIAWERFLAGSADRVIATCTDELAELADMGVHGAHCRVVPCGVDLDVFHPVGARWPAPGPGALLASVGRLVPRKGVATAVEALRHLPPHLPCHLVVACGDDTDRGQSAEAARLRKVASDHGVGDRVHLVGPIDRVQVAALMRSAHLTVCAPWYEPFGIVPIESMACGTPVVGTAVGGLLDTVAGDETGLLVPPRDPVALAGAIHDVLRRNARGAMGTASRARALRFGWDRVVHETVDVYREVCDRSFTRAGRLQKRGAA